MTSGADGDYVLLEHVRDAFHFADEFTLDGEPVPFLEDEHLERYSILATSLPCPRHLTSLASTVFAPEKVVPEKLKCLTFIDRI